MTDIERLTAYLLGALYGHHGAGGNLHVAVDDGNLSDEMIWWCQQQPQDSICGGAYHLGIMLAPLLRTVRRDEDSRFDWVEEVRDSVAFDDGDIAGRFAHEYCADA